MGLIKDIGIDLGTSAVKLLLMEPFALPCGAVDTALMDELPLRSDIVRNIASDFDAVFLPLQEKFDEAIAKQPEPLPVEKEYKYIS